MQKARLLGSFCNWIRIQNGPIKTNNIHTKVLFIDPKSFWASPNTFWSGPKYLDESALPANVNSSEFPVIPGSLMPNEGCKKQDYWVVFAIALESRMIQ